MNVLNALVAFLNFVVVPALSYGSQLAIGALGVTLIFAVLRFSNFAWGDTMAFGTTLSILLTWWFTSMGISGGPLPTALLALPFGGGRTDRPICRWPAAARQCRQRRKAGQGGRWARGRR